eukprot:scaffold360_cov107-Cylindrotheca_fusiformis.AAC.11
MLPYRKKNSPTKPQLDPGHDSAIKESLRNSKGKKEKILILLHGCLTHSLAHSLMYLNRRIAKALKAVVHGKIEEEIFFGTVDKVIRSSKQKRSNSSIRWRVTYDDDDVDDVLDEQDLLKGLDLYSQNRQKDPFPQKVLPPSPLDITSTTSTTTTSTTQHETHEARTRHSPQRPEKLEVSKPKHNLSRKKESPEKARTSSSSSTSTSAGDDIPKTKGKLRSFQNGRRRATRIYIPIIILLLCVVIWSFRSFRSFNSYYHRK